jgi:hypothetical protein
VAHNQNSLGCEALEVEAIKLISGENFRLLLGRLWTLSLSSDPTSGGVELRHGPEYVGHCVWINKRLSVHNLPENGNRRSSSPSADPDPNGGFDISLVSFLCGKLIFCSELVIQSVN